MPTYVSETTPTEPFRRNLRAFTEAESDFETHETPERGKSRSDVSLRLRERSVQMREHFT